MRAGVMRGMLYAAGVLTAVLSLQAGLSASIPTAPEIDASSLSAGLGLLTATVLIVRSRSRK